LKNINLIYFFRDKHDTNTKETNSLVTRGGARRKSKGGQIKRNILKRLKF